MQHIGKVNSNDLMATYTGLSLGRYVNVIVFFFFLIYNFVFFQVLVLGTESVFIDLFKKRKHSNLMRFL